MLDVGKEFQEESAGMSVCAPAELPGGGIMMEMRVPLFSEESSACAQHMP